MTKRKKDLSNQPSLFELIKEEQENSPQGNLDFDTEFRCALSEDLKHACDASGRPISRFEVAARMSEYLGREITASQLNNWTSTAHRDHNIPAKYTPSFIYATGGQRRAFETLTRKSGLFAFPGPEALKVEVFQIDETISNLQREKRKRMLFLKEMGEKR